MTVGEWWGQYAETTVSAGVPPTVRRELEHAFYAGCFVMLSQVNRIDSVHSLNAALAIRESFDEEMRDFFSTYHERRAQAFLTPFLPGNA